MIQVQRRKFIGSACKACLLAGAGFLLSDLTACSPASKVMKLPIVENTVRVPVSSFATGSIQIVRPAGWFYDIAVRKSANDGTDIYEALLLECTHQQNQLMVNGNSYRCTLHGSVFNLEGQVTKGPAEKSLKKFKTIVDQSELVIELKS